MLSSSCAVAAYLTSFLSCHSSLSFANVRQPHLIPMFADIDNELPRLWAGAHSQHFLSGITYTYLPKLLLFILQHPAKMSFTLRSCLWGPESARQKESSALRLTVMWHDLITDNTATSYCKWLLQLSFPAGFLSWETLSYSPSCFQSLVLCQKRSRYFIPYFATNAPPCLRPRSSGKKNLLF